MSRSYARNPHVLLRHLPSSFLTSSECPDQVFFSDQSYNTFFFAFISRTNFYMHFFYLQPIIIYSKPIFMESSLKELVQYVALKREFLDGILGLDSLWLVGSEQLIILSG